MYYSSSRKDDECLREERRGESGAAEWLEKSRSETEDEAAETEGRNRKERFDPTVRFSSGVGSGPSKTKEDCIALEICKKDVRRAEGYCLVLGWGIE